MRVTAVVPALGEVELDPLLERLARGPRLAPFAPELVDFVDALSKLLTTGPELRAHPEVIALGHWARKSSIREYERELAALASDRVALLPRGFVFHVPPANVDTIFMYSWLLSLLAGNANLIRLSSRESPQVELVCERLGRLLAEPRFAAIGANTAIVRYGHEDAVSARISERIDLRVVWGGDATVAALHALPLPAWARELAFGDKFSFSAIAAAPLLALDEEQRARLAERFYNDAMWFDQAGCSSPRLVVFTGERASCGDASRLFFAELERVIERRKHRVELGHALGKLLFAYQAALDGRLAAHARLSNELSVLELESLQGFRREHPGAGLFFVAHLEKLDELVTFVTRRDQTLGHFGYAREELADFVRLLAGRGLDRLVPLGEALTFNRFWDGFDLLQEFTRRVYLQP